jgi:hypothetical protein
MTETIEAKIAEIIEVAMEIKDCPEENETPLCKSDTVLACRVCITNRILALIAADRAGLVEALIKGIPDDIYEKDTLTCNKLITYFRSKVGR